MAKIITNTLLNSPIKRVIENWKTDFRTSDGPNNSSFISLVDLCIPYDSHYVSRLVLPANSKNVILDYGLLENVTFLLIKVTYNGNYDVPNEDSSDPYYNYESNTYNINYYFEDNSGVTYPIGRLLVLNGSFNNKLKKIYLNNSLDYDVVLDVFEADIQGYASIIPSSAITITNLYYNDIITDEVSCTSSGYTTTTTTLIPTTTTTTTVYDSGITTTTTTTILKELMRIIKYAENDDYKSGYITYTATGNTLGLFDYYKDGEWIYAGEESDFAEFIDLTGIEKIRFYFELNDKYYGTLKDDSYEPIDHDTGLYFVDVSIDSNNIPVISGSTIPTTTTTTTLSGSSYFDLFTGSTQFIISEYVPVVSGYTIVKYCVPYSAITSITKDITSDSIFIATNFKYYTLKFLTDFDCNHAYSRMIFVFGSYLYKDCRYLTQNNVFDDGYIVI
jgi:hypothetical protein